MTKVVKRDKLNKAIAKRAKTSIAKKSKVVKSKAVKKIAKSVKTSIVKLVSFVDDVRIKQARALGKQFKVPNNSKCREVLTVISPLFKLGQFTERDVAQHFATILDKTYEEVVRHFSVKGSWAAGLIRTALYQVACASQGKYCWAGKTESGERIFNPKSVDILYMTEGSTLQNSASGYIVPTVLVKSKTDFKFFSTKSVERQREVAQELWDSRK